MDKKGQSAHVDFLDGVRGLLALWVLLGHAGNSIGISVPILNNPGKAVDGFMVLSGFLMAWHYILRQDREPWESVGTWCAFWSRRVFRIIPLYYTVFVITMWLAVTWEYWLRAESFIHPGASDAIVSGQPVERPEFWSNLWMHLTFLFGFKQDGGWSYLPDWSLALEMQFYGSFPFLMLFVRRFGIWTCLAVSTGIWILSLNLWGVYSIGEDKVFGRYLQPTILPLKLPHFVIGMALAIMWLEGKLTARLTAVLLMLNAAAMWWRKWYGVSLFLVLAGLAAAYPWKADPFRFKLLWKIAVGGLGWGPMRRLGDWSYGVYLIHAPVLLLSKPWFVESARFHAQPTLVQWTLFVGTVTVLTLPLAILLFYLVERPGIKLGKRLIQLGKRQSNQRGARALGET